MQRTIATMTQIALGIVSQTLLVIQSTLESFTLKLMTPLMSLVMAMDNVWVISHVCDPGCSTKEGREKKTFKFLLSHTKRM